MAKNLFNPVEIVDLTAQKVKVEAPVFDKPESVSLDKFEGPTADELRREAELFKRSWEQEKLKIIAEADREAEKIIEEARETTSSQIEKQNEKTEHERAGTEREARNILENAKREAEEIIQKAHDEEERIKNEAREAGMSEGHTEGWEEGSAELKRLNERFHKVLDASIAHRSEILKETESQIIDLVLLISRKVIKAMSENHKKVVVNNVMEALKKLKNKATVTVRVNLLDLAICTEHKKTFISMVENVESLSILEDSSIDPGGAVIETDFGYIDARIQSQLREIEDKIIELAPISDSGNASWKI